MAPNAPAPATFARQTFRVGSGRPGLREDTKHRSAERHSFDFVLRLMQTVSANHGGDFVRAIIVMTIMQANLQHLSRDQVEADGGVPDDRLRPISALAIANSLGVPRETVRRHIHRLAEDGVCRRVTGGYIIPETVLNRPEQQAQLTETFQHLRTFIAALRRADILES